MKNGNGEGSVRSKRRADGRWEARFTAEVAAPGNAVHCSAAPRLRLRRGSEQPSPHAMPVGCPQLE